MTWADDVDTAAAGALVPLSCAANAAAMRRYMKDVAPFLGIATTARRRATRAAWRPLGAPPDAEQVTAATWLLWSRPEREFHYAACDLLARWWRVLPASFLPDHAERLLTTTPWWDTVDALGSAVVNPLLAAHPSLVDVMWRWNGSGDEWLVRASIQHQRGRRADTDVPRLLAMCEPHTADRRFFVAKAVGWALRDLAAIDVDAASAFVAAHPELPAVARREAQRGIDRVARR